MRTRFSLLFISDSEETPNRLALALSAQGLEPAYSMVGSPLALSTALADEPWDIVVADPDQPGMPWHESLAITRTAREHTPFILLAEMPDPDRAARCIAGGADDFVTLDDWGLAPAFRRALQQGQRLRALARSLAEHRHNEEKFRKVIEDSMVGMFRCTPWGRLTSFNPAFARILGYKSQDAFRERLAQGAPTMHISDDSLEVMLNSVQERNHLTDFETRIRRSDGRSIWVSLSARAVRGESGELSAIEGTIEDIDRRKSVEGMIIRAKQEWERTFDSVPDIIVILDSEFAIRRMNMTLASRLGLHPKDAVGRPCSELFGITPVGGDICQRIKAMAHGEGDAIEMEIPSLDGVFLVTVSPFHVDTTEDSEADGIVLVAHDISSRKQLEAQLRQSQKLEAIGTLAGGIAHDFNNILGVIMGYAEMTLESSPEGSAAERRLTEILNAGKRARDLIHQILTFSRQEEPDLKPLALDSVIKEVGKMLRASLPSNIDIITHLAPEAGAVMANLSQIHQVLMNLCTNAAHAMRENGGTLSIALHETTLPAEGDRPTRRAVRLSVSDTGHGIPADIIDNVFDPFFTTKKPDEGTGMGLAMVHGIVNSHGGNVRVESSPGQGAAFHVTLPVAEQEPVAMGETIPPAIGGKGRALFVDDERALAAIGGEMLESLGFSPVVETDSRRALEIFRRNPQSFSLVITDQTMPGLSGQRLAREILALRPDIPIIVCTGYSADMSAEQAREMGIRGFLLKPVLKRDLAACIHAAMGEPQAD
ncbi:PAS domain S-box-containing protein [Desulfobaculum xiamenense]|uniref:histidine kinase n=1 Tax=Desulfobaculum xiamenense TaxID=995050 RepID=A0A846QJJ9_9BACT|nr:PAS domain S-box protein [Desulfobaculum xiamenense]NJB67267.1 PAS domain S-box-containing protein [Desulfobaculum xiamenense]